MHRVRTELVPEFWPLAEPLLRPAVERTRGIFEVEDVEHFCRVGDWQLWLVTAPEEGTVAAMCTSIQKSPRALFVRWEFGGGTKLKGWKEEAIRAVETWARGQGASRIHLLGRKGWIRVMWKYGYRPFLVVLEKML